MTELTKDRAPRSTPTGTGWITVDSRQVLSAADEDAVARLREAGLELERLGRAMPAVLYMMREAMAGQPLAAAGNVGGGQSWNWCEEHERSTEACDRDGLLCEGIPRTGPSDPTGNAGVLADMAKRDYRDMLRLAELVAQTVRRMDLLQLGYPHDQITLDEIEVDDLVGTVYCRACHKNDKALVEVTLRAKTGKPYYAGLCKWCGERAAAIGGDPPEWMVAKHHRGDRVGPGDLARAKKVYDEIKARDTTSKGKKRKRK